MDCQGVREWLITKHKLTLGSKGYIYGNMACTGRIKTIIWTILVMPRDYKKERRAYYGYGKYSEVTALQQRHRREKAGRGVARKKLPGCKGDVHHKNHKPTDNRRSNLACVSRSWNRARNTKRTWPLIKNAIDETQWLMIKNAIDETQWRVD